MSRERSAGARSSGFGSGIGILRSTVLRRAVTIQSGREAATLLISRARKVVVFGRILSPVTAAAVLKSRAKAVVIFGIATSPSQATALLKATETFARSDASGR